MRPTPRTGLRPCLITSQRRRPCRSRLIPTLRLSPKISRNSHLRVQAKPLSTGLTRIRVTRSGGFADVEMLFDGKTLTLLGKNKHLYTQLDAPGTIDQVIDELREKFRPLPGADLLLSNVYDQLMTDVVEAKDLGSGVIGGTECDHLAFRAKEVDWQIWIAQGDRPYPCRYVITSKLVANGPQYSIQTRDWKTGDEVASDDFGFKNSTNAKKIDLDELDDIDELPKHFAIGGAQ